MRWFLYSAFALVTLLAVWLVVPTTEIVNPDWDVVVTDLNNQPIPGATVRDISQQCTFEVHDTELDAVTGADGRVHFQMRRVRATGLRRLLGTARQLQYGPHASFGVHTYLVAFKPGYGEPMKLADFARNERESLARGEAHQSSHLWLMKCAEGYSGMGCTFPDDPSKPVLPFNP